MSTKIDSLSAAIAERLRFEREMRGWTLADLAERAGVSKAMISKIERGETSPTAVLLGKLSGAFGITLSKLLAHSEEPHNRLVRAGDQPKWKDPETGYVRTRVTPNASHPIEIIVVELPPGASVAFPASSYAFIQQSIWVTSGTLTFTEGKEVHQLTQGDCLQLGPPADCAFTNGTKVQAKYAVILLHR
jgi:transcriptional regulator with XRE-family HTH domain